MKKLTYALMACLLFVVACQKTVLEKEPVEETTNGRTCATTELLEAQLALDPGLHDRLNQMEAFSRRMIESGEIARQERSRTIEIPVVVHVLYANAAENISDAQVQSQIDVLNEDYNLRNPDHRSVPELFSKLKADVGIRFTLEQIIRKHNPRESWPTNNIMKYSMLGGSDAVDPSQYLNIWVCDLGQSTLGFSSFPGYPAAIDGVVITTWAFGRTGRLYADYNRGRTTTHEIGHWMYLYHIWGNVACGSDEVGDTPLHNAPNYNCPDYPHFSTCVGTPVEMTMNYMDYTDDACMYMFTKGQKDRMLSIFAAGGPRYSFAN